MKTRFKCVWIRSTTTGHRIAVNIVTSDGQLMKRKLRSVLVNNGRNIQEIPAGLVLELLDDIKSKLSVWRAVLPFGNTAFSYQIIIFEILPWVGSQLYIKIVLDAISDNGQLYGFPYWIFAD